VSYFFAVYKLCEDYQFKAMARWHHRTDSSALVCAQPPRENPR
jgi:hypothetical protein